MYSGVLFTRLSLLFLSNSIANYQFLTYVQKYKHNLGFHNVTMTDILQTLNPYVFINKNSYSKFNIIVIKTYRS